LDRGATHFDQPALKMGRIKEAFLYVYTRDLVINTPAMI
jgi:hypothetical protein